jgi:hypothetical protein
MPPPGWFRRRDEAAHRAPAAEEKWERKMEGGRQWRLYVYWLTMMPTLAVCHWIQDGLTRSTQAYLLFQTCETWRANFVQMNTSAPCFNLFGNYTFLFKNVKFIP